MTATAYRPEPHESKARLAELMQILHMEALDSVRFMAFGRALYIEGCVPSYDAKRMIESAARKTGFQVENSLRIIPGTIRDPAPHAAVPTAS